MTEQQKNDSYQKKSAPLLKMQGCIFLLLRRAAHVSDGCKFRIRPAAAGAFCIDCRHMFSRFSFLIFGQLLCF
jgi:hypothetical protein